MKNTHGWMKPTAVKSPRRANFTLIEIFVSLTILLAVASLFTFQGIKLLGHYRLENRLSALSQEIYLMRQVALSYNVHITLKPGNTHLERICKELDLNALKLPKAPALAPLKTKSFLLEIAANGHIAPRTLVLSGFGKQASLTIDPTRSPLVQYHAQP
ncbi:MAG: hypothetical protein MRY21_00630 [Simkaniaceae bacterium]|nr:hypothetical protein [Simkaniaceae bacterium]